MRHRDVHVLSVDTDVYTTDQRIHTTYNAETDVWTLQVKANEYRASRKARQSTAPWPTYN